MYRSIHEASRSRTRKLIIASAVLLSIGCGSDALATSTYISFDGYCDQGVVNYTKPQVTYLESIALGSCEDVIGEGFSGRTVVDGNIGRWLIIGNLYDSLPNEQATFVFQFPLVTSGKWFLYATADGQTMNYINSGTYTIVTSPAKAANGLPPVGGK